MKVALDMYPDGTVRVRTLDGTRAEGVERLRELLQNLKLAGVDLDQLTDIEQHSHEHTDAEGIRANS